MKFQDVSKESQSFLPKLIHVSIILEGASSSGLNKIGKDAIWPTSKFNVGAINLKMYLATAEFKTPNVYLKKGLLSEKIEQPATSKIKPFG